MKLVGTRMTVEVNVQFTPRMIAEAFCEMNDEEQAQFFIEASAIAQAWKDTRPDSIRLGPGWQWWSVGRHLRNCECSTPEAREMVKEINSGAETDL